MNSLSVEDLIDQHYEDMQQARGPSVTASVLSNAVELAALFTIARWLWEHLRPAPPDERFRAELHSQLVAEAERRRVQRALQGSRDKRSSNTRLVMAALGTASLVGAYAYWRVRRQASGHDTALAA